MSLPSSRPLVIQPITTTVSLGWLRLLPAWLVSAGVHAVVVALFLLVTISASAGVETPFDEPIVGDIELPAPPPDLTNPFEGLDADVPPGIPDLDRLGDRNLPGLNMPDQPVGPAANPD